MGKKKEIAHKALIKLILILTAILLIMSIFTLCACLCVVLKTPALIVNIILVLSIFIIAYFIKN